MASKARPRLRKLWIAGRFETRASVAPRSDSHVEFEDVPGIIERYRTDSRKYRRVHNGLQSLIMVGSAATTTVAALVTGKELTWRNLTIVGIGFAITLAAAFTGYYKYRERSYFLQQTADEPLSFFTWEVFFSCNDRTQEKSHRCRSGGFPLF